MQVKSHIIRILHQMELTNGETFTANFMHQQVNQKLYFMGVQAMVSRSQVSAVLNKLVRDGSYQGNTHKVNIRRRMGEYQVSWEK